MKFLVLLATAFLLCATGCQKRFSSFEDALRNNATSEQLERYLKEHHGLSENDRQAKHHPLHVSIQAKKPKYVELLLRHGAPVGLANYGRSPLMEAMVVCDAAIIALLLDKGADPKQLVNGRAALTVAAESGCLDGVKRLLARKIDPNQPPGRKNPLARALETGHALIAAQLLDAGARAEGVLGRQLLSGYRKNAKAIATLLASHPKLLEARDGKGLTLLHRLATDCRSGCVDATLDAFMKLVPKRVIELGTTKGGVTNRTALHLAAKGGNAKFVKLLLRHGAKLEARDQYGRTALHLASGSGMSYAPSSAVCAMPTTTGYGAIVTALLEKGANPKVVDKLALTPLHVAVTIAGTDQLQIIAKLLAKGADPNAQDAAGHTPLHRIVGRWICGEQRVKPIVRLLVRRGANPNLRTKKGRSALELANPSIRPLLQKPAP